jgi:hypothetical protein
MNKLKWKHIFSNKFNIVFDDIEKIIFYNNPNVCNNFMYEKVNPNHIGYVYGKRKEKHKGHNWIKVCKISVNSIIFFAIDFYKEFFATISLIINNIEPVSIVSSIFISYIFYSILFKYCGI